MKLERRSPEGKIYWGRVLWDMEAKKRTGVEWYKGIQGNGKEGNQQKQILF